MLSASVPATAKSPQNEKAQTKQLFLSHMNTSFSRRPCYIHPKRIPFRPFKNLICKPFQIIINRGKRSRKYTTIQNTMYVEHLICIITAKRCYGSRISRQTSYRCSTESKYILELGLYRLIKVRTTCRNARAACIYGPRLSLHYILFLIQNHFNSDQPY